jgi:hypothetical protein
LENYINSGFEKQAAFHQLLPQELRVDIVQTFAILGGNEEAPRERGFCNQVGKYRLAV